MRSSRFQHIDDVWKFLDAIPQFGRNGFKAVNFSLDRMLEFCKAAEHPEKQFSSIHVAGTNGKGTVCQMLASVFQEAGYSTGLYTSPHLVHYSERIKIDGIEITDEEILRFFREHERLLEKISLTYFEISTCLAFWYFAKKEIDIGIIETGMGGRLDATNIILPEASVITSISMDHTDFLGDSISKIAFEKAGIIKENRPVVTGLLPEEAMKVIRDISEKKKAPLILSRSVQRKFTPGKMIELRSAGKKLLINGEGRKLVDADNAAIALALTGRLQGGWRISDSDFVKGIEAMKNRYPEHAHFQKLHPSYGWYFDGAHNNEAIESLITQLEFISDLCNWTVILSMMDDKISKEVLNPFRKCGNIWYYEMNSARSASVNRVQKFLGESRLLTDKAVSDGFLNSLKSELVIFTGSFYFYHTVRHWMGNTATSKR